MDIEVDTALIGPLTASAIPDGPVEWGNGPQFLIADDDARQYVEADYAQARTYALGVLQRELQALLRELVSDSEPRSILHGLVRWGELSVPRMAGYLGRAAVEVSENVRGLQLLDVVRREGIDQYGDEVYRVNVNADILASFGANTL